MNGNVKVYLMLAILLLWVHTLFTAHELVSLESQLQAGGDADGPMKHITAALTRNASTQRGLFRFPSSHGFAGGGLSLGADDGFARAMPPATHVAPQRVPATGGGAPWPQDPPAALRGGGGGGGDGSSGGARGDDEEEEEEFHVIFSTDCSAYQHWQSLTCFYSAQRVGQRGTITRIASGCTPEEERAVAALHERLPGQFKVHFTPDFKEDKKTGKRYDFFNKVRERKRPCDWPLRHHQAASRHRPPFLLSPLRP